MPKSSLIPSEWETGSFYDKWSFSVANSMLQEGEKKPLELNDLLHIPIRDHSEQMLPAFREAYMTSKAIWFLPRLMVAQIRWAYIDVIIVSAITVVEAGCMIVSPLLLNYLLKALENEDSDADCYMYAALLSGVGIIQVFIHHVVFFISMRLGWNWKNVTTALIHEKLIQMDVNVLQSSGSGTGMLVNMISNDVARFEEFPIYGSSFWVSLLVVAAVLVELIFVLDVPSAVAGAGTALVMLPVMIQLAKLFAKYRGQTAASTDGRVRYISEVIEGIASVKSYAWETAFFQMIRKLRASETKYIARSQVLKALNQGFMFCMSSLVSFSTFAVFWANGGTLTIPLVFSTIALLQVLRFQIGRAWIRSIESGSESIASSLRIEKFLDLKAHSGSAADVDIANTAPVCSLAADEVLSIKSSSYCYGTNTDAPVLKGLSLSVSKGELLMVVGPVGSGKSSLLAVALGELHAMKASGTDDKATSSGPARCIAEDCSIAYCAQRPWILAASVKSNITFAGKYLGEGKVNYKHPTNIDQALYAMAVESALIVDDFKQWAAYDDTEVGERGISVSGGQKARISLARAIYADADLYLLDDPLSAVDAHVGHALMTNCIVDTLKKRNKAVILATHQLQNLKFADKILVLDGTGNQVFYGTHGALLSSPEVMASLDIIAAEAEKSSTHDDEDSGYSSPKIGHGKGSNARSRGGSVGTAEALMSSNPGLSAAGLEKAAVRKFGTKYDPEFRSKARVAQLELEAAAAKVTALRDIEAGAMTETALETQRRQVVQKEVSETGNMSWAVYWRYASSGGALSGVSALAVICLSQGVVMITEYWLRWWAKDSFGDQSQNKYVAIYAGLVVCCILIGCYRALAWFRFTLRAASNLQERCLWAVIHSPMTFFVSNPTGRILNRFSKDQNQMDEMLPTTMFAFIESSVYCLASLVLICITIPWIAILVPFLVGFFVLLRRRYITSTREIKRIEAVTRSPIYADFSATLEGLTTLRAYKLQSRVSSLFQEQIDENGRPWFSFLLCARWLGLRLDMETAVVLAFVCFLSVILRTSIDVGLLGFALVYTLSLSGLFQLAVRWSVDVETQMTAVERISSYCQLPPEEGYATSLETALLKTEPQQHIAAASKYQAVDTAGDTDLQGRTLLTSEKEGHLTINDMTATYRRDLDPVLRHINIDIPAGFKVGICGRTGSGKSSSLLALLRLNIITAGDIVLDGESLLALDLQSARSRLSIIPQDPHLFSGTIRFNLDPFSSHTDSEIWGALQDAHIHDHVKADPLGLSAVVEESGKNFSVGQRQLLSLARAILRRSKVVLMDEVTASIDYLTDRLIQETIRTSPALRDSTIITVAHRLRTIADSDLIVVVQAGEVIEMGAPGTLLLEAKGQTNHNSEFTRLVQESNDYDEIFRIATSKLNSKK